MPLARPFLTCVAVNSAQTLKDNIDPSPVTAAAMVGEMAACWTCTACGMPRNRQAQGACVKCHAPCGSSVNMRGETGAQACARLGSPSSITGTSSTNSNADAVHVPSRSLLSSAWSATGGESGDSAIGSSPRPSPPTDDDMGIIDMNSSASQGGAISWSLRPEDTAVVRSSCHALCILPLHRF
jgi:hypothetical protein